MIFDISSFLSFIVISLYSVKFNNKITSEELMLPALFEYNQNSQVQILLCIP